MNKINILTLSSLSCAILFSIFSINFSLDISVIAFPIGIAFSLLNAYFLFYKGFLKNDFDSFRVGRKLLQYIPFVLLVAFIIRRAGNYGTPYWIDLITVIFWILLFVSSLAVLHFICDKRVEKYFPEWKKQIGSLKLTRTIWDGKRILLEIVDWIDALVQAIFMVLLIQIFVLQLYVIPSESMVPSFLIGDRVVVFKTASGPVFPLSDVGLPSSKKYNRGDVVVFRNPHYAMDRKSEVKTVVSQIVYMLTFTGVNLNVDENGNPKADPLVKRICGVPGEQLVMQDGILYSRTAGNDQFKNVEFDEKYAAWNLDELPASYKAHIQTIPLPSEYYEKMIEIEKERRSVSLEEKASSCKKIASSFDKLFERNSSSKNSNNEKIDFNEYLLLDQFFENPDVFAEKLFSLEDGRKWFDSFMTEWTKTDAKTLYENDPYSLANFTLNVMAKELMGKIVVSQIQNMNIDVKDYSKLREYFFYISILDQRNMPVFPANDENGNPSYIPEDSYFMMGDNRFNSLDMRHSYEQKLVPLSKTDPYSIVYYSNMEPQFVSKKKILGTAVYRFWPWARRGPVQTK